MIFIFLIVLLLFVIRKYLFFTVFPYFIKVLEISTLRIVSMVSNRRLPRKYINDHQLVNNNVALLPVPTENFNGSRYLQIISKEKIHTNVSNLKLSACPQKPLVVCLTWLSAKRKNILKYANLYLDHEFDVLTVSVLPWQALWPVEGTQLIARDVLEFLNSNENYSPIIIHGFSTGGYLWGEMVVLMEQEQDRYKNVVNRIRGMIWDSAVDITEIHIGLPIALFPKNQVMQSVFKQYMIYRLKAFNKEITSHYVRSSQMFHTKPIRAPTLMFVSKTDPIGTVSANTRVRESWESLGIRVYWKCFEKSSHVGHFRHYPQEYESEINAFLDKLSLTAQPKYNKA